jgi:hypothetical protein
MITGPSPKIYEVRDILKGVAVGGERHGLHWAGVAGESIGVEGVGNQV